MLKSFKNLISVNEEDTKDLRIERANLDAAAFSSTHIEKLKQDFRKTLSEFEELLDLGDDNTTDIAKKIKSFNAETWCSSLYKTATLIVNKALAIQICVKLHNKLFPDEIKTTLTDYEKELVKELTDKEFA
jgi:hypothetical protein